MTIDVSDYSRRISFSDSGEAFWAACIFTAIADGELHDDEREIVLTKLPHLLGQVRYRDTPLAGMLRPFPGLNEQDWPEIYRFVSRFWDPATRGKGGGIQIASITLGFGDDGDLQDEGGRPLAEFWDRLAEVWSDLMNAIRAKMAEDAEPLREGSADGRVRLADWTGPVIDEFVADFSRKVCAHFIGDSARITFLFSAILNIGQADGDAVGAERIFVLMLARDLGIEDELRTANTGEMARKYALNLENIPTIVSGVIDPDSPRSRRLDRMAQVSDRLDEMDSGKQGEADALRQLLVLAATASPQTAENFRSWSGPFEEMLHSTTMVPKSDADVLRRIGKAASVLDQDEAGQFLDDMMEIICLQSLEHYSDLPGHVDVLAYLMNGNRYKTDEFQPEIIEMTANEAGQTETIRVGGALAVLGAIAIEKFGPDRQGELVDRYVARMKELVAEFNLRKEAEAAGSVAPDPASSGVSIMRVANPAKPDFVIRDGKVVSAFGVAVEDKPDASEAAPLSRIRSADAESPEKAEALRSLLALVHVHAPQLAGLARAAMEESVLGAKSAAWNELVSGDDEGWWKGPSLKQVLSRLDHPELMSFLQELGAVLLAKDVRVFEGLDLEDMKKFLLSAGQFDSALYKANIRSVENASPGSMAVSTGGGLAAICIIAAARDFHMNSGEVRADLLDYSGKPFIESHLKGLGKKIAGTLREGNDEVDAPFDPASEFRRLKRYLGKSKAASYKKNAQRELLETIAEFYDESDPPETVEAYLALVEEGISQYDELGEDGDLEDLVLRAFAIGRAESFFRKNKYAVSDRLKRIFVRSRERVARNGDVLAELREREGASRRNLASENYSAAENTAARGTSGPGNAAEGAGGMIGCVIGGIVLMLILAKCMS